MHQTDIDVKQTNKMLPAIGILILSISRELKYIKDSKLM